MNLKDEIKKLVELQKNDVQIYQLSQKKDYLYPQQLDQLKTAYEEKKKNLTATEQKVKDAKVKHKDCELTLATKQDNIQKAQAQLYQLKTNKEYQAKLSEIASIKADVSLAEENVIKAMEGIEMIEKNFKVAQEQFAQEEAKYKEEESKIRAQINEIETQLTVLCDKRSILSRDVDKTILSRYEHLLRIKSGLAIVPVRNENCGACHMRLRLQTLNEIKMYNDLVFCGNCSRIVYFDENE